jgi:uncharacterized membrane protein
MIHQLFVHDDNERLFFSWLKVYQKIDRIVDNSHSLDYRKFENMKLISTFWKRVRITMNMSQVVIYCSSIGYNLFFDYLIFKSLPKEYHLTYAPINCFIYNVGNPFAMSIFLTSMCVFHHVCYHLKIRFQIVNNKISNFRNIFKKNSVPWNKGLFNYRLIKLLLEHNQVCLDLHQFNHFWKDYLAIKYLLLPLGIQLCTYVSLLAATNIPTRVMFLIGVIILLTCLTIDCLSASFVHKKTHSCYQTLNRISMDKRLSLRVKIKLNNYIQRLDGKSLSFTCFNLFNVTYASYFYVS